MPVDSATPTLPVRRVAVSTMLYLIAYAVAAGLDLWTTVLATSRSGAQEGNAFVTAGPMYMATRALTVSVVGGLIMAGCVAFSATHAVNVDRQWLLHPIASFRKVYLNPWSPAAMAVSPLHMLSLAIAFVVLRLLAAGNNLMILRYGFAPIGKLITLAARHTSPVIAFAVVIIPVFYLLAIAVSPIAARVVSSWEK